MVIEDLKIRFLKRAAEAFRLKPERIDLSANMENTENWDSLNHLKLFMALEEEFQINFPSEKLGQYKDLMSIYKAVETKTAEKRTG